VDYPQGRDANTVASAHTISVSLNLAETQALLHEVPQSYQTQINDVLLTALLQACAEWTGVQKLMIGLEGHGREGLFEDVDLSRTVGWFTTFFPVLLDLGGASEPGAALKSVKEQLRAIPNQGIGYGLLRYLRDDTEIVQKLRDLPQPEVTFNYLGQSESLQAGASVFKPIPDSNGAARSLRGNRAFLLEINGRIIGGQLQMDWSYSENLYRYETIAALSERFLANLRLLIAHCQASDSESFTPSDFPLTELDGLDLERLSELIKKIDQSP
jgi:non-ribosomal peptide synthase protein (TIGR01720 family)